MFDHINIPHDKPNIKTLSDQVTIRLDPKLYARIKAQAQQEGRSKANMMRHIRRACATTLFENGSSLIQIKDYLGHASISTVFSYVFPRVDFLKDLHLKYHPFQKGFL